MSLYLCMDLVIDDGFCDGGVAVEDGLPAVGASSGTGGGAKIDFGNEEIYLHGNGALSE